MSKFATFRYSPYTNSTNSQFNPALYNNKGAITGCVGTKDMRGGENIKTSSYYGLKAVDQNTASVLRGSYAPIVVQSHSQCAGGKKRKSRKNIKNKSNIFIAYEPIWSIGSGVIPTHKDLFETIKFIKNKFRDKPQRVLYGGSVNPKNIINLKKVNNLDGFLVGGASQSAKKFIDIVKKTYS